MLWVRSFFQLELFDKMQKIQIKSDLSFFTSFCQDRGGRVAPWVTKEYKASLLGVYQAVLVAPSVSALSLHTTHCRHTHTRT